MGLDLDVIKARHAAATPGPWEGNALPKDADGSTPEWWRLDDQWNVYPPTAPPEQTWQDGGPIAECCDSEYKNGDFITHSWEDVRALVAEVERLRDELGTIRDTAVWDGPECRAAADQALK